MTRLLTRRGGGTVRDSDREGDIGASRPIHLICRALLHDVGRVDAITGRCYGLIGASLTEEFLELTWVDEETIRKSSRIAARHTPHHPNPPQTIKEGIVFDADTLERFRWIGLLRGIIGKKGSIKGILEEVICRGWGLLQVTATQ